MISSENFANTLKTRLLHQVLQTIASYFIKGQYLVRKV